MRSASCASSRSQASERIAPTEHRTKTLRELAQQLIAGLVPKRIVDRLETVDVHYHQRERASAARGFGHRTLGRLGEPKTVRQVREHIVTRRVPSIGVDLRSQEVAVS